MEFLRHPLYSIVAVIFIGLLCRAMFRLMGWRAGSADAFAATLASIGAAFLGFHFAMLSNLATDVIVMPFAVALTAAALANFALGRR